MIGFNALGQLGRLGNQMFQFAALKGIARHHGYQCCFPPSSNKNEWTDHQLLIPFKLSSTNELNIQYIDVDRPTVIEKGFGFDQDLFNNCPDWVTIQGFFQTEKYFKHIEKEIKNDFTFRDEISDPCNDMISTLDNPIALHIRRGDFLINSANHHNLPMTYYENGLDCFDEDRQVVIFSDDPEWCFEQKLFDNDRFLVSQSNSPYHDLYLMTQCSDFIIANSTYSWWGAWLCMNPFKEVIYPNRWFGPNNASKSTADLFPRSWRIINED